MLKTLQYVLAKRTPLTAILLAVLPVAAQADSASDDSSSLTGRSASTGMPTVDVVQVRGVNGDGRVEGAAATLRMPLSAGPAWSRGGAERLHARVTGLELNGDRGDETTLVAFGPEWQWRTKPLDLDMLWRIGTAPTVLSDDRVGGKRIGGRFHFTSHIAMAMRPPGSRFLRITAGLYHVSNAGLQERNPGFEIRTVGLSTFVRF